VGAAEVFSDVAQMIRQPLPALHDNVLIPAGRRAPSRSGSGGLAAKLEGVPPPNRSPRAGEKEDAGNAAGIGWVGRQGFHGQHKRGRPASRRFASEEGASSASRSTTPPGPVFTRIDPVS
jgi:hypothetical protein